MVIYAEYLFLENAVTGGMILILVGKIAGVHCKIRRVILGSILCGLYSFILFWDRLGILPSLLIKLAFSAVLILLAFRPRTRKQFARILLLFYFVSFAMGGITIGMMYFLGILGVTQNAAVYLGVWGYLTLLPGLAATWLGISLLADFLKGRMQRERTCAFVKLELEGKSTVIRGMVDTGNYLVDPLSGKPVIVISEAAAKKILPGEIVAAAVEGGRNRSIPELIQKSSYAERTRLIPYHTVNGDKGWLIGVRLDAVSVAVKSNKKNQGNVTVSKGTVMAISSGMFVREGSEEGCSILLHPNILEGGIACDV